MLKDRINLALEEGKSRGLTQKGLADACGIAPPSVNDWTTGRSSAIKSENIWDAASYLGVDPRWLATGKGHMRAADAVDYEDITGFAQAVGLGAESEIAEYEVTHKLKFRADSLGRKRLRAPYLNVVYGKGDSMLPRIKTGDAILFDTSDIKPHDGRIYIVCYPSRTGGIACSAKQCMELDGIFYFQSLNNDGDHDWKKPRRMDNPKHQIEIMGRVRWIGSWED